MKITREWLEERNACLNGMAFVTERKLIGLEDVAFIEALTDAEKFAWAVWTLVRLLKRKRCLQFAIFCARDVLPIYEAEYPANDAPRKAIEAAERCIESDTPKNRRLAAYVADAAAYAAYAARAVYAAGAATYAAYVARAASAASAAAYAARAVYAAVYSFDALPDLKDAYRRYIAYGLELLKDQK